MTWKRSFNPRNAFMFSNSWMCLYSSHECRPQAISVLERLCNRVSEYLSELGLHLSPEKSAFCIVEAKQSRKHPKLTIKINGIEIGPQTLVKFLRIHFQSNLKWNTQVEQIYHTCAKSLGLIRFLRGTWWGTNPDMLLLYKSLVTHRSRLEYGASVWGNLPNYLNNKLRFIQMTALKYASGLMR